MARMMDALVKPDRVKGMILTQVPVPTPGPGEVLIKIRKTAICGTDVHIWDWNEWAEKNINPPYVVGHEYVGEIAELGEGVTELGGLHVIGSSRRDARRIDRQLGGRCSRQGDPGSSVFYVSLEDNLMRLFGSERISKTLDRLGFKEGEMIEHSMISKSIERAQKKVEENNFGIRKRLRKRLLEYDDVMNKQRTVVYTKRRHALIGERIGMDIVNMIWDRCCNIAENYTFEDAKMETLRQFSIEMPITDEAKFDKMEPEQKAELIFEAAMATFKQRTERMAEIALPFINFVYKEHPEMHDKNIYAPVTDGRHVYQIPVNVKAAYESQGKEVIKCFEKSILLHTIDSAWKENLRDLDELKHSVQNASYEQKDPLLIFKLESVTLFDKMVSKINDQTVSILMRGQIPVQENSNVKVAPDPKRNKQQQRYNETKVDLNDANQQAAAQRDTRENAKREPIRVEKTVGRNDPCPCGSGKKFKNCHGKNL